MWTSHRYGPGCLRRYCRLREHEVMNIVSVRRIDFGYFVRPAAETRIGVARVEPCLGYVVDHPQGRVLFDTGMGSN